MSGPWKEHIQYPEGIIPDKKSTAKDFFEIKIAEWLDADDPDGEQMIRWCQGYDLGGVGHEQEPYHFILMGFPLNNRRNRVEQIIAARVQNILKKRPDIHPLETRPQQVLYNLLMVCGGLSRPEYLADPLYLFFQERHIQGEWLGYELTDALLLALINNQSDDRLWEELWLPLLKDQRHDYLPGSPIDAFHGVRLMPFNPKSDTHCLQRINLTLKCVYEYLKTQSNNYEETLEAIIEQAKNSHPGFSHMLPGSFTQMFSKSGL